jgi:hypothetical protein
MKERIGETAGKIWQTLRENDEMTVSKLPKVMKEKETVVYQALGWLARENKVAYRTSGNRTFVSVSK